MKPFAESCEQNKQVILDIIKPILTKCQSVLEIGSGTGQHAVFFGEAMPHLQWYTSEKNEMLDGIQLWLDEANLNNVHSPMELDVTQNHWTEKKVDAIFMANTLHIMHWDEVQSLFQNVSKMLDSKGIMLVYGPFNYNGNYTSESNREFDAWLKSRDPLSGIRDIIDLKKLANDNDMMLLVDFEMPANNRILYWQKN